MNMVEGDRLKNSTKSKNKGKYNSRDDKSSKKNSKLVSWKCEKPGHFKKDYGVRKVKRDVGPSRSKDPKKKQC